ncbi:MAG: hypothetical protein ACTSUE_18130 [Promethearchaeota archaeon]
MNDNTMESSQPDTPSKSNKGSMLRALVSIELSVLVSVLIIFTLSFLLAFTGIWWLAFISGFVGGFFMRESRMSFLAGVAGLLAGWGVHLFMIGLFSSMNDLNVILSLLGLSAGILSLISLTVGALLGGLGALNGSVLKQGIVQTRWYKSRCS